MKLSGLFIVVLLSVGLSVHAQDSSHITIDTLSVKTMPTNKRHSAKKAALQSALLPGLGQIYNKKYWKLPIIYAGFAGLGFAIGFNTRKWRTFSDAYSLRIDDDPSTQDDFVGVYSDDNLLTFKNFYKRNMDLSIIFTAVLYALNIIDAAVDAHLFEYDISDDLSLRMDPVFNINQDGNGFAGLKLSLKL